MIAPVLRIGSLLNEIVLDDGNSAVRKVDAVAGSSCAVDDAVVIDRCDGSPTFDFVPDDCVVNVGVGDRED